MSARTVLCGVAFSAGAVLVGGSLVSMDTGARPAMSTPAPLEECATTITTTDARTGAVIARLCDPLVVVRTNIGTPLVVTR